ncbi:MAG: hypothetical protein NTW19_17750 [Planctomycetota bacterium]|nr:hypothetical protein [Planctomycetota bacterium]
MITLYTIPKPFTGPFARLQENAVRSWMALGSSIRIILVGNEEGTADCAKRHGLVHVPEVGRNQYGTPLLNDIVDRAEAASDHRLFCYINADIILMSDFLGALGRVGRRKTQFLMVGQRWDFNHEETLETTPGWELRLREQVKARGKQHRPTGIDYFVYNRGMWGKLPPFAIGRFTWDNWLIYRARSRQVPVIDASSMVMAVHQNHDYSHVGGGLQTVRNGPEARFNLALAGGGGHLFTIWDSTHILSEQGLVRREGTGLGGGIWSYRRSAKVRA